MSSESAKIQMFAISRSISNFDADLLMNFTTEFRARQNRLKLPSRDVKFVQLRPEADPYIDLLSAVQIRMFHDRIDANVRETGVNDLIEALDETLPPLLDEPLTISSAAFGWFRTRRNHWCMKIGVSARTRDESQICRDAIADYYQIDPEIREALWRTEQGEIQQDPGLPFAKTLNPEFEKLFGYVGDALRESEVLNHLVAMPTNIVEL